MADKNKKNDDIFADDADQQPAATAERETRAALDEQEIAEAADASHTHSGIDHGGTGDDLPPARAQDDGGDLPVAPSGGEFFIDMKKADERQAPMLAGTMVVVSCTAAEAKTSSAGNPMIGLRVQVQRVQSVPVASTDTRSYAKRTVRDNMMFIPPNDDTGYKGTIWRANQTMRAFGVEPDHGVYRTLGEFMAMLQRKAEEMIGCVAVAELGIDDGTNNGTRAPEIDASTGEPYPPKNVVVRFHKYIAPAARVPSGDGDDLPF